MDYVYEKTTTPQVRIHSVVPLRPFSGGRRQEQEGILCNFRADPFFSRVLINGVSLHFDIMSDYRDIMDLALSNSATKLAKHRVVTRPE